MINLGGSWGKCGNLSSYFVNEPEICCLIWSLQVIDAILHLREEELSWSVYYFWGQWSDIARTHTGEVLTAKASLLPSNCCKNCSFLGKLFGGFSGVVKSYNLIMMEMASPALAILMAWSFTTSDYANLNPLQHGNISTCDDNFTSNFVKDCNL